MKELSKQQTAAATFDAPQIMVIAGPGSGKTHTTVSRIVHMIQEGKRPDRMVAITFTVAAAEEIQKRIAGCHFAAHHEVKLGYAGTLHGWCLRIIQDRFGENLMVIGEEDATAVLKEKAQLMKYRGSMEGLLEMKAGRKKIPSPVSTEALVLKAYRRELRSAQLIDFDHILELAHQVLLDAPHYANCTHLFVDEYQDSSPMDAKIYAAVRAHKFFVGDPDQAIYGFRGGSLTGILDAANSPAWIQFYLDENYRSGREICRAADLLIQHNQARVPKILKPIRTTSGPVELQRFVTDKQEMQWIVKDLMAHQEQGILEDCAVLCRTNALVKRIAMTLETMGMHTRTKHDALPEDWNYARAQTLFYLRPEDNRLAKNVLILRDGWEVANEKSVKAAAKSQSINAMWLGGQEPVHPDELLMFLELGKITLESRQLIKEALMVGNDVGSISAALLAVARQEREEGAGVTVTTIHGAKGREWDTVYLPGWEQDSFPGKKIGTGLEEERRLAFVGITRARERVVITTVLKRDNPYTGRPAEQTPSQFIEEAGL